MSPKPKRIANLLVLAVLLFAQFAVGDTKQQTVQAQSGTYSISGRVTDGSGNGVSGVTVFATEKIYDTFLPQVNKLAGSGTTALLSPSSNSQAVEPLSTATDEGGYYTFASLPTRPYRVWVKKDSIPFTPPTRLVDPTSGVNQDFTVLILTPDIAPETEVIDPGTNQYLESISQDGSQFTFTQSTAELQSLAQGDIMASGVASEAPNGYLRKVASVTTGPGGSVVVVTEPAVLEDAVEDGSIYLNQPLDPADITGTTALPGVTLLPATAAAMETFSYSINGVVLYDGDGNPSTDDDQIKANGSIEFEMETEFYLNIQGNHLRNLTFADRSTVRDTLEIVAEVNLASYKQEKVLASHTFAPITVMIGVVPVVFLPRLDVVVGVDGSVKVGISTSVSHEQTTRAGVEYIQPSGWRPISERTSHFSFTPPHATLEASVKGYFGLRFNLYLYGVAGPYVKITPFLEFSVKPLNTPWWVLYGGVEIPAGFRVVDEIYQIGKFFLLKLDEYEVVAISFKTVLAQADTANHAPNTPSSPSPANAAAGVSTNPTLSWTGGDPDGDAVVYDVYFEAGDATPDVLASENQAAASYAPSALAPSTTYYWQINATDEHGISTTGPVWRFTTTSGSNQPPNIPSAPTPPNSAISVSITPTLSWTGGDPNGDTVTFDVYFESGDVTPDVLVSNNQSGTSYNAGTLTIHTTYYWQVIAQDEHGATAASPVWSFTTGDGTVIPGEMVTIPAGNFQMGCDPNHNGGYSCNSYELPLHSVYLDAYRIDKYEVTTAQYAQCAADGSCAAPAYSSSYTRTSYYGNPTYASYPVIYVSWYDAANYCAWAGKRLPTEAEWEKAARGTTVIAYPWGDQSPTCTLANYWQSTACVGDTSAVGSYPAGASPYGAMDMAGNVWEWVSDWWQSDYYSVSPSNNPQGPASGSYKVLRGGGWFHYDYLLRAAYRFDLNPTDRYNYLGFRCAAPPGN